MHTGRVKTDKKRTEKEELEYLRAREASLYKQNIVLHHKYDNIYDEEVRPWSSRAVAAEEKAERIEKDNEGMAKKLILLRIELENQTKWADRWRGAVQALAWQQGLDIDELENKL